MQLFQSAEQFQDENVVMVLGVEAARVWEKDVPAEEQKQRLNGDKVPVWEITCAVQDGWLVAGIKVRVAAETKPAVSPGPIRFGGLQAFSRQDGNKHLVSFAADTWTQEDRPSLRRGKDDTVAPAPPPVPTREPAKVS